MFAQVEGNTDRAEARRVAAVHRYGLLDPTPGMRPEATSDGHVDEQIDALARVAAVVTRAATVTVNLIDAHRHCPLSAIGVPRRPIARSESLCATHFTSGEALHVPDLSLDPRYADHPWVDGRLGAVRSYTSIPLLGPDGYALGTLCAADEEPRRLRAEQLAALQDLAGAVVALFERRRQATTNAQLVAEAEEQRDLVELLMAEAEHRAELNTAVLASVDVGIVVTDPDGRLVSFNDTARDWLGAPRTGLPPAAHASTYGLFSADGTTPLDGEDLPLQRVLSEGVVHDVEMVLRAAGRGDVSITCSGRTVVGAGGEVLGAVLALHDVTAARQRQAQLQAAHTRLEQAHVQLEETHAQLAQRSEELSAHTRQVEALAGVMRTVVCSADPHQAIAEAAREITDAEAAYLMQPDGQGHLTSTAMTGFAAGTQLSLPMSSPTGLPLHALRTRRQVFVADVAHHPEADPVMIAASDTVSGVWQPVLNSSGEALGVLGIIWRRRVDELPATVTAMLQTLAREAAHTIERADLLVQLAQAAQHDALTGLTNRRRWDEVAQHEISHATRAGAGPAADLTFALIDLDHFKTYNDTHGHLAGDELLRSFALAAATHLREVDTLARWGGEEFVVALPGCSATDAVTVADRIRASVPHGQSATIGLAQWRPGEDAADVLDRADGALYKGKNDGRDRTVLADEGGRLVPRPFL
ncbi:diguanylate cyclase [Kineococcus radiotolerans SRS30216 = ATCC BAA-149]|uniref:Diguanylate cyclase n=1 Tax=Kineococcus radiotolerans (strain ATCC BAA-149 / DSM 14245 / SRS30216) TaxID=266940 RepID=A6WAU4_KINRD|nr:diguanylate cyclase [Kineococcus radiotolerans SRS30216 = ATCC BAA-149]